MTIRAMTIRMRYAQCRACGGQNEIFYDPRGGHWPSPADPHGKALFIRISAMRQYSLGNPRYGWCPGCIQPMQMIP